MFYQNNRNNDFVKIIYKINLKVLTFIRMYVKSKMFLIIKKYKYNRINYSYSLEIFLFQFSLIKLLHNVLLYILKNYIHSVNYNYFLMHFLPKVNYKIKYNFDK